MDLPWEAVAASVTALATAFTMAMKKANSSGHAAGVAAESERSKATALQEEKTRAKEREQDQKKRPWMPGVNGEWAPMDRLLGKLRDMYATKDDIIGLKSDMGEIKDSQNRQGERIDVLSSAVSELTGEFRGWRKAQKD